MLNLPQIKWHVQKLHKLLEPEPNNPDFVKLLVELGTMLNSFPLKNIDAAAPVVADESTQTN